MSPMSYPDEKIRFRHKTDPYLRKTSSRRAFGQMKSENGRLQGYLYTINEDDKRSCSIMLSIEKQRTNETGTNIKKDTYRPVFYRTS